ncbi:hypothetical protein AeMF1_008916 [Aphanomyces euteiches]|nr:hypothetical protein AeMF1_008916 [Aphanomyces euteiches]KAH9191109.1 hypothetical protein AeNC1_006925 [Aphanomyces euteiches]
MADARAAARKARILASQEKRLKYVTGQADSLKKTEEEAHEDKTLDEMANELHPEKQEKEGLVMPTVRVDPAQRRRDAALRKEKQQAKVEERLNTTETSPVATPPPVQDIYAAMEISASTSTPASTTSTSSELVKLAKAKQDLFFYKLEQWSVALLLILGAVVLGSVANTEYLVRDPRFQAVDDLLAQGFTLDAIKQQMERDNVDTAFLLKRSLSSTTTTELVNTIPFLPTFLFDMFAPALVHPPLMLAPIIVRLVVGGIFFLLRTIFQAPATADHESDDMGWIVKLVLAQVPRLRDGLRMVKKTGDDFCLFVAVLCVTVAVRCFL